MKKGFAALFALSLSFAGWAQSVAHGALGTKGGGSYQAVSSPQIGFLPILQLIVALGIVTFLLKWALPKVAERLNKGFTAKHGQIIKIEETTPFPGGHLLIVTARGRTLLVGTSGTQMRTLADLTDVPQELPTEFESQLSISEEKMAVQPIIPETNEAIIQLRRLAQFDSAKDQAFVNPLQISIQ